MSCPFLPSQPFTLEHLLLSPPGGLCWNMSALLLSDFSPASPLDPPYGGLVSPNSTVILTFLHPSHFPEFLAFIISWVLEILSGALWYTLWYATHIPPSWIKNLFPQLLGVLPEDGFQPPALFGHCLSCRELTHPRSHPLLGRPTFNDWLTEGVGNLTPSSQLETALNGHLGSRSLCKVRWGCCSTCSAARLLPLPTPAFFPSLPQVFGLKGVP